MRSLRLSPYIVLPLFLVGCAEGVGQEPTEASSDDQGEEGTPAAGDEPDSEETFELTMATYLGPEPSASQAFEWWADEVTERTNGQVTFVFNYLEALCPTLELLPCARDGRADIVFTSPQLHPSEFPLGQVVAIPFQGGGGVQDARALQQLYNDHTEFRNEYENQNVRVLWFVPVPTAIVGSNEPIDSIDWFQGKNVRTIGYWTDALHALGTNPVATPSIEIYESLERGVIDAFSAFALDGAINFNLQEVTDHWIDPGLGGFASGNYVINKDVWESLPSNAREVMSSVSQELLADYQDEFLTEVNERNCQTVADSGVDFSILPEDEVERWRNIAYDDIVDSFFSSVEQSDDPQGFLDQYLDILKQEEKEFSAKDYVSESEMCLALSDSN